MRINILSIVLIVFIILSSSHCIYGQWELLNPKPTTMSLETVYFLNKDIGFAGGEKGIILKTNDGGVNWKTYNLNNRETVRSIYFKDVNVGFALTSIKDLGHIYDECSSHLYKTTDGGENWVNLPINTSTNFYLTSMKVVDEDTIYLAGFGNIIKTIDRGANWTHLDHSSINFEVNDMYFESSKTVYLCGIIEKYDTAYYYEYAFGKSTDYGNSWVASFLPANNRWSRLRDIYFADDMTGFAVGDEGVIFKTSDAGKNWQQLDSITSGNLTSVCFSDSKTGFITCDNGKILKTTDAGLSWSIIDLGNKFLINNIYFVDKDYGVVVGDYGLIYKTTDAFNSKENLKRSFSDKDFNSVSSTDDITAYICGENGMVFKTNDGGYSWSKLEVDSNVNWSYIYFPDKTNGYVYGRSYSQGNPIIYVLYKTNDGGNHWTQVNFDSIHTFNMCFINSNVAYASSLGGMLLKTEDGWNSWKKLSTGLTNSILDLSFKDESLGHYIYYDTINDHGDYFSTYRLRITTDSAKTWKTLKVPDDYYYHYYLTLAYFIDSITGFIVIGNKDFSGHNWDYYEATMYKTTDGGITWKHVYSNIIQSKSMQPSIDATGGMININKITFIDENRGYAIGYDNNFGDLILETTDRGETWQDVSYGTNSELYDMSYTKSGVGYIVGSEGTIFKFGDSVNIKVINVKNIKRDINIFPNPADDITKLSGRNLLTGFIEIYNLTGIKVFSQDINSTTTSVNTYNLSDGMYILKYYNKEFTVAKKLIVKH